MIKLGSSVLQRIKLVWQSNARGTGASWLHSDSATGTLTSWLSLYDRDGAVINA